MVDGWTTLKLTGAPQMIQPYRKGSRGGVNASRSLADSRAAAASPMRASSCCASFGIFRSVVLVHWCPGECKCAYTCTVDGKCLYWAGCICKVQISEASNSGTMRSVVLPVYAAVLTL